MPWFPGGGGGGGSCSVTGAANEGSGAGLYDTLVSKVLKFRSLKSLDSELIVSTTEPGEVQLDLDLAAIRNIDGGQF